MKFQIVALSSSKCTYGLDFEDSGRSGICLHTAGVRKILNFFEVESLEKTQLLENELKKMDFFETMKIFQNFTSFSISSGLRTLILSSSES